MKKTYIYLGSLVLFGTVAAAAVPVLADTVSPFGNGAKTGHMMMNWKNLSATDKAALQQKMAARKTQNQAKLEAIQKALDANDYNAWVAAVGSDSAIAKKVTADNFPKLVDAYNLMKQAHAELKGIGIDKGDGLGFGMMHGGFGMGMRMMETAPSTTTN